MAIENKFIQKILKSEALSSSKKFTVFNGRVWRQLSVERSLRTQERNEEYDKTYYTKLKQHNTSGYAISIYGICLGYKLEKNDFPLTKENENFELSP